VLLWDGDTPRGERLRPPVSVEQCRAPVAEAAAQLLAEGEFQLVRVCEHPDCTLWFYDRTKSHKRRWCSMAVCGNRHKVAEYRKRQQA
jgi:predicted RNA-binding Zn ribbon-like protein